jgi:hypothetical protein
VKCPICKRYFESKKKVLLHMNERHASQIPPNMTAALYYYALNHGGDTTGKCRICNDPTNFDELTGRVKVLCKNPKCKEQFAKIAQQNNIKKFGVPHLLNDQTHQMMMLSKRRISGTYMWSDAITKIPYVGSYERRFLEFLDNFLSFDPSTIYSPCPIVVYYGYDGETLTHSPDFYIDILDLIVEIKHGGDNPNTHPKIQSVDVKKDSAKELAVRVNTDHNYIKITDNDFRPFLKLLFKLTENEQSGTKERLFIINESAEQIGQPGLLTEADDSLDMWMNMMDDDLTERIFHEKELPDLYFQFFGEITRTVVDEQISQTFLGPIDIAITLEDSFDNMIRYIDGCFQYVSKEDSDTLTKKWITTYKYIGELDLTDEINYIQKAVKDKTHFDYVNEINAYVSTLQRLFDTKSNYTLLDITLNSDLAKYRKVTQAEAKINDVDEDLLSLIQT